MDNTMNGDEGFSFSPDVTLEDVRKTQHDFCTSRNWGRAHKPRNLLLAMMGEVGELAEIFQWRGEVEEGIPEFSEKDKQHVGEELSDVLIYLVSVADRCHIDLAQAVKRKFQLNAIKYPEKKTKEDDLPGNKYKR